LIWKWTFGKDFIITEQHKPTMAIKFQWQTHNMLCLCYLWLWIPYWLWCSYT